MAPDHDRSRDRTVKDREREQRQTEVSRRSLIKRTGGLAALSVGTAAGVVIGPEAAETQEPGEVPQPYEYAFTEVPDTPAEPPPAEFVAFSEEQAAIVDALTARILPGTPDDPGAREAGVVYYIDFILSTNSGIHEATYTAGPYARSYEGDSPPARDDERTVWVKADQISRYGFQAPLSPLDVYEIALPLVQEHARQTYGAPVQELSEADQDQIVWDLLDDKIEGFEPFPPSSFFHTLRRHTGEGMFSDPAYGGNRDLVGWKLVGYPGAQRAYSPEELLSKEEPRPPQSLHDLPAFHPGVTGPDDHPNVIQPVRDDERDDSP